MRHRAIASGLFVLAVGCNGSNTYQPPPPPEVVVARPVRRPVTSYLEHTGTAQASERVELRARVRGFLKERRFKDGRDVKAGQLLFVIDEEPFRVRLDQTRAKQAEAEAMLRKAEQSKAREIATAQLDLDLAALDLTRVEENRARNLVARNAGTRGDLDKAEADRKKAEAQVLSDRATLEQSKADHDINILAARSSLAAARADVRDAEINLGYCRIAAPFDGRINAREFDVGNYVGEGTSTVLAAIVKTDPIYANITPSEEDLLLVQKMARGGGRTAEAGAVIPMEMGLGNEEGYPHRGQVDYSDPSIDTGTGTVRVRGIFPNPGGLITPGLFVRTRVPFERRDDALLVPDRALGADQGGPYLLVVGKDSKVERRAIRPGIQVGGLRVVDGKIGPEDRVVVEGLLRARPGLEVKPKLEEAAEAVAASPAQAHPIP
jgi:membrane fusion protein (multidrug efflux system)